QRGEADGQDEEEGCEARARKAADHTLRDPHAPGRGVHPDGDADRDGHEQREAEADVRTTPGGTELDIRTRARTKRAAFGQSDRPSRDIAAGGPRGVTGRSRAMTPRRHNRDRHSHPHGLSRNEAAALLEKAPSLPRRGLSGPRRDPSPCAVSSLCALRPPWRAGRSDRTSVRTF